MSEDGSNGSPNLYNLSRRRVLGGLGAIGVASAGAGLGTSAFFSDEETFTNNQFTAGSLDLKVGWEEHYSDWSDDESNNLSGSVQMESDSNTGGAADLTDSTRVGLPSNAASLISVQDAADAQQFLDNTQEDKYPSGYESENLPDSITCANGDITSGGNVILSDDDGGNAAPAIDLGDVKPGDFGEVTFSFALCDNPGYVWAGAFIQNASENGTTEPELEDPDEDAPNGNVVELLDEIQVAVWLDDGNNFQNCGEQPYFVGSLRDVANADLPEISGQGYRLDGRNVDVANEPGGKPVDNKFTAIGVNRFDYENDGDYEVDFDLVEDPDGGRQVAHATSGSTETGDYATSAVSVCETIGDLESLTYEYRAGPQHTGASPDEVWLLVQDTNGEQSVIWRNESGGGIPSGWQTRDVAAELQNETDWNVVTDTGHDALGGSGDPADAFADVSAVTVLSMAAGVGGLSGKVSDLYVANPTVNTGDGDQSLGHFPTSCFRGEGTVYNGVFAWWLPVDHANEIQTDTVTFDLGLYTEQCRHNPGNGPAFDSE